MYQPTAWEFIEASAERVEQIKKSCQPILAASDAILRIYNLNAQLVDENVELNGNDFMGEAQEIATHLMSMRRHVNDLYRAVAEPETYHGAITRPKALTTEEQQKLHSVFEIKATVWGQWVVIKMPLLPSRYNPHFKPTANYETNRFWAWYFNVFDVELASELLKIRSDFHPYPRRNLAYFHIKNGAQRCLADGDNFDTKHVTDTVNELLDGSDNPSICSFVSWSEVSSELPEGSYLCVSPRYSTPPSQGDVKTVILASGVCSET